VVELGRAIAAWLPGPAANILKEWYGRHRLREALRREALADPEIMRAWGITAAPPPELRMRVHGAPDLQSFLIIGKENYDTLLAGLALAGKTIGPESRVLDFGCGSGRTLRWWVQRPDRPILHGTDVDQESLQWAREHLPVEIHHNDPLPPLPFPDRHFDLIYAISVFTHLDEQYQDKWLAELGRVLKDDGVALLSVRSAQDLASRPPALQSQVERDGIVFKSDWLTAQFFDDFYQATYHSADYIARHWSRFFKIVGKVTAGYVDIVVVRRQ
jgi:SAM-dependent methyltransferase